LRAWHDGIHRVAAEAGHDESAIAADLQQRVVTRINRTAATGNERGAQQLATAGQIQQGTGLHVHQLPRQRHADLEVAIGTHATDTKQLDCRAVVQPAHAIDRAA